MQHLEPPSLSVARRDLEDAWRVRSETARERYETASRQYRKLLDERPEGLAPEQDDTLALARRAESVALAEYTRILRLFTELTVHRRIPEEQLGASGQRGAGLTDGPLISVVDDDESVRDSTTTLLRSVGYEVATFESGEMFLDSITLPETRCVILDIRMPGMSGLDVQRCMNLSDSEIPVIFVTAHDNTITRTLAMSSGASAVFHKPFAVSDFLAAVEAALKRASSGATG